MNILERANQIVNERSEEKERQYGPFSETMERATAIYNAMAPANEQISTKGLYRALIALKLSREAFAHKEDNLLDAVAYMGALNNYIEENTDAIAEDVVIPDPSCFGAFPAKCKGCKFFDDANFFCNYKNIKAYIVK